MSRIFAIPDIHGRKDLLDLLCNTLKTEHALDLTKDKLVFLGDMVDRGPDSKGVLDTIRSLQVNYGTDRVIALAGNHEWIMIDACISQDYARFHLWMINGGGQTQKSFPGEKVPDDYIRWCAALPLFHEEPGFFFSHAPIGDDAIPNPPDSGLPFQKDALIWTYRNGDEWRWTRHHDSGIVGVCGHIHRLRLGVMQPRMYKHYIFADSGCGCSDKAPLVAVEVNSREVIYAWPVESHVSQY